MLNKNAKGSLLVPSSPPFEVDLLVPAACCTFQAESPVGYLVTSSTKSESLVDGESRSEVSLKSVWPSPQLEAS